jgi:hypothetical protein
MADITQKPTSIRMANSQGLVQIAAAATNTLVHTLSTGRTAKIKKIMLMNNTGVNDTVTFGELVAGAWTQRLPAIYVLTPFDEQISEWEIPEFIFQSDIYARSAGAGAATPEDVLIEVEEIG